MRLTLRTMLAYLDDILEPTDAEELGEKIRESEFASGLVHRIRSCTQKLRLGAPKLEGKGIGLDANTVAEYLDNTLPQDRVPDFEKVCLESDVHLAEVASCHQILALVLGEPAEVASTVRERVYRIASELEHGAGEHHGEHHGETSAAANPADQATPGSGARGGAADEGEVDHLGVGDGGDKAPVIASEAVDDIMSGPPIAAAGQWYGGARSPMRTVALTVVVAFLLVFLALMAMGPFNRQHPLVRVFGGGESPQVALTPGDGEIHGGNQPSGGETRPVAAGEQTGQLSPGSQQAQATPGGPSAAEAALAPAAPPEQSPLRESTASGGGHRSSESTTGPKPVSPPGDADDKNAPGKGAVKKSVDEKGAGEKAADETSSAGASSSTAVSTTKDAKTVKPSPADDPSRPAVEPPPGDGAQPVAPDEKAVASLGRFFSEEQVLARFDEESSAWRRLPPNAALMSGDRLIVLPTYRPQIVLALGVQLTLAGSSSLKLLATENPREGVDLAIEYGWAVLAAVGAANAQIQLDLAGRRGTATFVDADSSMAVEVQRYLPPGADPEKVEAQRVVQIFVVSGRVDWQEEGGELAAINAGAVRSMIDDEPAATGPAGELPAWIERKSVSDVDRWGSEELEQHVVLNRPVNLSLEEQVGHRKVEVKTLAMRCLCLLGQYEPCVMGLSDENYHSYWYGMSEALREAAARGRESAAEVRTAFERLRGDDAALLYRFLWGCSPEELGKGAAEQLVGHLEHPELDVRVLAFDNLRRITGLTESYQPHYNEVRRKSLVRRWRDRLSEGAIVYKTPPTALPERKPSPEAVEESP